MVLQVVVEKLMMLKTIKKNRRCYWLTIKKNRGR